MSARVLRFAPQASHGPLAGKRIVLTRPRAQSSDFADRIRALGGEPVIAPAIATVPPETWTIPDAALRRVGTYDWIVFTSANAVRALLDRADTIGIPRDDLRSRRLAVVGPGTAAIVGAALRPPDFVPSIHTAESLGWEIADVESTRVLLPRGDLASDMLPATLRKRGAFADEVLVYRTVPGPGVREIVMGIRSRTVDALLFTSASAVRFVAAAAALAPREWPVAVCLGPVTADAAREVGCEHVVVAEGTTQAEMIEETVRWFTSTSSEARG